MTATAPTQPGIRRLHYLVPTVQSRVQFNAYMAQVAMRAKFAQAMQAIPSADAAPAAPQVATQP